MGDCSLFFIAVFIIAWAAWIFLADKKRWRELFPVSIFAALLGVTSDILTRHYPLWSYEKGDSMVVHLGDDFGLYIVIPYLFIQWLPRVRTFWKMAGYWFVWTTLTISIELIYLASGHLEHHKWWSSGLSYSSDWLLFWLFYQYHRIFQAGRPLEGTSPG